VSAVRRRNWRHANWGEAREGWTLFNAGIYAPRAPLSLYFTVSTESERTTCLSVLRDYIPCFLFYHSFLCLLISTRASWSWGMGSKPEGEAQKTGEVPTGGLFKVASQEEKAVEADRDTQPGWRAHSADI